MKTFVIERTIPGASSLSQEELSGIAKASNAAIETQGVPYRWVHSYVAGDKFYCVHEAENEQAVRAHAACGGFPVDSVAEVVATIDGSWAQQPARA